MAAGVRVDIKPEELELAPGTIEQVKVVLQNQGEVLDQFDLEVRGIDAGWYTLTVKGMALFPGDKEEIDLTIHPPRDGVAGSYKVDVTASSRTDPTSKATASWSLRVARPEKKEAPPKEEEVKAPPPPPEEKKPEKPKKPPEEKKKAGVALQLQPPSTQLSAGEQAEVIGKVENTGEIVDQFEIQVSGLNEDWLTVEPTSISLFPKDSGEIHILLKPPATEETTAGDYPFKVRATSQADAAVSAEVDGILRIRPFYKMEAEMRPRKVTGRQGRFELELANQGNAPITVLAQGEDPEAHCTFALEPEEPALEPHKTKKVPLRVRVKRFGLVGEPKSYRFKLDLVPKEWPQEKKSLDGELVHKPLFRTWKPILIAAALVLLLAVALKAREALAGQGGARVVVCRVAETTTIGYRVQFLRDACRLFPPTPPATPVVVVATEVLPADTPAATEAPLAATAPPPVEATWPGRAVFVSGFRSEAEIELVAEAGQLRVKLTQNTFADSQPEVSPDGTLIAFQSNREGSFDIWVMKVDGTEPRNLTGTLGIDEGTPTWSPDGQLLAYERRGEIWVMRADGSDQKPLLAHLPQSPAVQGSAPSWSPDGSKIAYMFDTPSAWQIIMVDIDSGGFQQLTDDPRGARFPEWHPDGQSIVYNSHDPGALGPDVVYLLPVAGGEPQALTDRGQIGAAGHATFSADGKWLFFNADEHHPVLSRIFVRNMESGEISPVTGAPQAAEYAPHWGP